MKIKQPILIAVCSLALATAAANAQRCGSCVVVSMGPPAAIREVIPPPPAEHRDWAWHNGYHRWDGKAYIWVPGRYEQPPYPHARWVEGHWDHRSGGYVWLEGHWRR